MDAKFVVRAAFDRAAARAMARSVRGRIALAGAGAAALFAALTAAAYRLHRPGPFILCLTMAAFFLLATPVVALMLPGSFYRTGNRAAGEITYAFGERAVGVSCALERTTLEYAALARPVEMDDCFILRRRRQSAFVLPKAAFESGDPGAFLPFLERKTGLTGKRLRRRGLS